MFICFILLSVLPSAVWRSPSICSVCVCLAMLDPSVKGTVMKHPLSTNMKQTAKFDLRLICD